MTCERITLRADNGLRTRDLHHGEVALFRLSYIRVEPPAGLAPAPSSLPRKRPDLRRPRRLGAAVRCRPGPPALRRRDRSRARRPGVVDSYRGWNRTSVGLSQSQGGCQQPSRYRYGRRDSNSQAAGFEPARYACSRHARMVRRQGLEPRIPGLRVQCCTRIARGARHTCARQRQRGAACGSRTRIPGLEGRHTSRCVNAALL